MQATTDDNIQFLSTKEIYAVITYCLCLACAAIVNDSKLF